MSENQKRRCNKCKFFATQDSGYSNYTVEETEVHCVKDLNPAFPCDESYSWKSKGYQESDDIKKNPLLVAITCSGYKPGDGICLDVDGESTIEDWKDDVELYEIAKVYFAEEQL